MNNQIELKQLLRQAWQSFEQQNVEQSIHYSQLLNKQFPQNGEAWFYTHRLATALQNTKVAEEALRFAVELTPDNIDWQLGYAKLLLNQGHLKSALQQIKKIVGKELSVTQLSELAHLYFSLNLADEALIFYKQALTKDPENSTHHYNVATIQRHLGRIDEAEISLKNAIQKNPEDVDAISLLAELTKPSSLNNVNGLIESLLQGSLSPKQQVQLRFALAKSYEQQRDFSSCFAQLNMANRLRRQHLNYNVEQDLHTLKTIQNTFDLSWWQKPHDSQMDPVPFTPIFIVGMPRTGSTLIDRILSNNNKVYSAGELSEFTQVLTDLVNTASSNKIKSKLDFITASKDIDLSELGKRYLDRVWQKVELQSHEAAPEFVIDKLPFNFLYLALIKKALPNAIIIHSQRDAMDTCFAIYKTLFDQAYPFAYQQNELAQYFIGYQKLMNHWRTLGLPIFTVNYEELVQSPTKVGKTLYKALNYTWTDSLADVTANKSMVNTASSSQVRQKIHTKSVGNWRNFEDNLSELKTILTDQ